VHHFSQHLAKKNNLVNVRFFFQTFGLELGGHQIVLTLGADGLYMVFGGKKLGLNLELDDHLIDCIKS
jgi:hypothetical protein